MGINNAATIPVWSKMTPNITDITDPARVCLDAGSEGIAAINTIQSVMGVNLKTLRPEPSVEGYTTPGGYSSKAVKPIALARVMQLAKMLREEYPNRSLSGIGGVETGADAAEFILLGSDTVQVCTGVMVHGYGLVKHLCAFKGLALDYFTTHMDLVARQKEAIQLKKKKKVGLANDANWTGEGFTKETDSMVSNN